MKFAVKEIDFFERDVRLRMPFRFGVVTLTEAPQAFALATIEWRMANGPRAPPRSSLRRNGSTRIRR